MMFEKILATESQDEKKTIKIGETNLFDNGTTVSVQGTNVKFTSQSETQPLEAEPEVVESVTEETKEPVTKETKETVKTPFERKGRIRFRRITRVYVIYFDNTIVGYVLGEDLAVTKCQELLKGKCQLGWEVSQNLNTFTLVSRNRGYIINYDRTEHTARYEVVEKMV